MLFRSYLFCLAHHRNQDNKNNLIEFVYKPIQSIDHFQMNGSYQSGDKLYTLLSMADPHDTLSCIAVSSLIGPDQI